MAERHSFWPPGLRAVAARRSKALSSSAPPCQISPHAPTRPGSACRNDAGMGVVSTPAAPLRTLRVAAAYLVRGVARGGCERVEERGARARAPSRLPSSDEPCWLVAGREVEGPRRASSSRRARSRARGRRQARPASWRLCQAPTCRKTSRSALHVTQGTRLGAARAASPRRHQAHGRRSPPNRQRCRGSGGHSTRHTVVLGA